jgi:hypothetical protein
MEPQPCPKCGGEMEQGFLFADGSTRGVRIANQWAAGIPKWSFWRGLAMPERRFYLVAMRCTACGFVETYATDVADLETP